MKKIKIKNKGQDQLLILPPKHKVHSENIDVKKMGEIDILLPGDNMWMYFEKGLTGFTEEILSERNQPEF